MTLTQVFLSVYPVLIVVTIGAALQYNGILDGGATRMNYLGAVEKKHFFVGDNITDWWSAISECGSGMDLVRLDTPDEYEFAKLKVWTGYGPFWLGARDIGRREMYRWSYDSNPNEDPIGTFISFRNTVEEGHMSLMMHPVYGSEIYGAHSHKKNAKAFCQLIGT